MSQPLSVVTVIEKNRVASDTPFLVCIEIGIVNPASGDLVETLRLVRNTEAITCNGLEYQPAMFDIELKQAAGEQQQVTLAIKDFSKAVQARMQAYGGGIGFNVKVLVVNGGALNEPPEISEYFEVVGASAANYVCSFILGAENALARRFPRRRQTKDYCQWRYKDEETCKYAGTKTSCDYSLQGPNGCAAHFNTINFGGFPGIQTRDMK